MNVKMTHLTMDKTLVREFLISLLIELWCTGINEGEECP